jgi:hypothetical protein
LYVLKVFLDQQRPDILAVTESWGRPELLDSFLTPDGYVLFRNDRLHGLGGGVFLLVRHELSPLPLNISDQDAVRFEDSVWCTIPISPKKNILVGCVYRSPSSSSLNNDRLVQLFNFVCRSGSDYVIIAGDFNCPSINWNLLSCPTAFQFLLDACLDNFLSQVVNIPTRNENILDLVFLNDKTCVTDVRVNDEFPGSDHKIVSCSLFFDSAFTSRLSKPSSSREDIFDFSRANWPAYRSMLDTVLRSSTVEGSSVDDMWINIRNAILQAAAASIPKRVYPRRVYGVPLSGKVRLEFRRRKRIFQSLRHSNSPLANDLRKEADDKLQSAIICSRKAFETKVSSDCHANPKRFWGYVRSCLASKPRATSVLDANGSLTQTDEAAADAFNSFFASVFTVEDVSNIPHLLTHSNHKLNDLVFSAADVAKVLKELPSCSSPGPDGIANILLKEGGLTFVSAVVSFFRKLASIGDLPAEWKLGYVIPIFKKGSRSACANYRPISLTCTLCKVFERIIKSNLLLYLIDNNLLKDTQHGFLPRRSCCSALLSFLNDTISSVDDFEFVDVLYLDFAKAFDSVPHQRLISKLRSLGVGGTFLKVIISFLTNRQQRVRVGNSFSSFRSVTSGVPQGSVLGPLLFLIYMNDVDEAVHHSKVLKFADDMKIFSNCRVSDIGSPVFDFLQDDLNRVNDWCSTWLLKLNSNKCACLHLGFNNPGRQYYVNDIIVPDADCVTDLGVVFTNDFKPSAQCKRAASKAQKMLAIIKLAFKYLGPQALSRLFKSFVLPLLEYCSIVWCPFYIKDIEALERVQRRFTPVCATISAVFLKLFTETWMLIVKISLILRLTVGPVGTNTKLNIHTLGLTFISTGLLLELCLTGIVYPIPR